MINISTYSSKSGRSKCSHRIYVSNPHVKSLSSLVLLNDFFLKQDVSYLEEPMFLIRIKFSRNFLHKVLKETGCLDCSYCRRKNLIIEERGMVVKDHLKATIDHVQPISKGGGLLDEQNIIVACGLCNRRKGSMSLGEFLVSKYKEHLKPNMEILSRFM